MRMEWGKLVLIFWGLWPVNCRFTLFIIGQSAPILSETSKYNLNVSDYKDQDFQQTTSKSLLRAVS